ncbi:MAG: glycine/betaine/sarcosine/D-proline family reductase selenoprotein B [Clostridium sp.]|uniref:glycine/betaine/sarcosine/D-proline family reductase selenoprotein B n=1 Tax=Clostridium sp. TaxID=1506 RepID=UPI003D6D931A
MIRIVQFLNQVQAGLGGDEQMDIKPQSQNGAVGMGMLLKTISMKNGADIVGTVTCGDNYFMQNKESAIEEIIDMIKKFNADVVICGPALNYKRYGECCGHLTLCIQDKLKIPSFAAMSKDSTGTEMFRKKIHIIETPNRGGVGLNSSLRKISGFAIKLAKGEAIGTSKEEGYFLRE